MFLLPHLLTGQYFTAVDLAAFARELDEAERLKMAEGDVEAKEYLSFLEVCTVVLLSVYCLHSVAKTLLPWHHCNCAAMTWLLSPNVTAMDHTVVQLSLNSGHCC